MTSAVTTDFIVCIRASSGDNDIESATLLRRNLDSGSWTNICRVLYQY